MTRAQETIFGAALLALLGTAFLLYRPGLEGPLVLDSIVNLGRLRYIGPVDDWPEFLRFVFSSSSGLPSRPLAFASFLINDTGWPLYVPAHKYTGVLIHLLNGALVCWLALLLGRLAGQPPLTAAWIALTTTALWLLAPLQVSTALYVIQRMTSLAALFALAGLVTYCHGRLRLDERPIQALTAMTAAIALFGPLGFLSKENAVLLPLFALIIERTLITPASPVREAAVCVYHRAFQWIVLILPVVAAFAFILISRGLRGYETRPFTAFERIASQPRILLDYLQALLVPVRQGMGVAHDDFVLSTGLLSPPSTVIAIVVIGLLAAAAIYAARKATPSLFAFAVLWFLAGHLMESTFISLEPYFEHRNYLPAFGLFFALSWAVWTTRLTIHKYLKAALGVYVLSFALVTSQNVHVWSNKLVMGETWAEDHPRSVRAQQIRADVWAQLGRGDKAHQILGRIADMRPDAMAPQLQYLMSACRAEPERIDWYLKQTKERLHEAHFDHAGIPTLVTLKDLRAEHCPELTTEDYAELIELVLNHDSTRIRSNAVADLLYLRASFLSEQGRLSDATANLYAAFRHRPSYDIGLNAVEFLFKSRAYGEAMKVLKETRNIDLPRFHPDRFRRSELEQWQIRIQQALSDQSRRQEAE